MKHVRRSIYVSAQTQNSLELIFKLKFFYEIKKSKKKSSNKILIFNRKKNCVESGFLKLVLVFQVHIKYVLTT